MSLQNRTSAAGSHSSRLPPHSDVLREEVKLDNLPLPEQLSFSFAENDYFFHTEQVCLGECCAAISRHRVPGGWRSIARMFASSTGEEPVFAGSPPESPTHPIRRPPEAVKNPAPDNKMCL